MISSWPFFSQYLRCCSATCSLCVALHLRCASRLASKAASEYFFFSVLVGMWLIISLSALRGLFFVSSLCIVFVVLFVFLVSCVSIISYVPNVWQTILFCFYAKVDANLNIEKPRCLPAPVPISRSLGASLAVGTCCRPGRRATVPQHKQNYQGATSSAAASLPQPAGEPCCLFLISRQPARPGA